MINEAYRIHNEVKFRIDTWSVETNTGREYRHQAFLDDYAITSPEKTKAVAIMRAIAEINKNNYKNV